MRPGLFVGAALAGALMALTGCGGAEEEAYVEQPVEDLYNTALDNLAAAEYEAAQAAFEEVDRQHPYSVWATKAQLMAAFAAYQKGNYDDAVVALDRFIELHPGNSDTAYAYYLKALCYYEQIADVTRDQRLTQLALSSLQDVVTRFPGTDYARDAALKIDLARDHLAGKQMEIGRYYLRQGQYTAAINRFRAVITDYQTTTHVPEALHRIAEAYAALGLTSEAQQVAAVLGYNYPGSVWYIDSYELIEGGDIPGNEDAYDGLTGISWLDDLF
ncbi:MAG: outer membrane protein assembly factor BamD [Alphaproteobacteria bacterium]